MKLFNKVAIVGVGLIGGSIALDIKKKRIANEVIGVSRHRKSLLSAKRLGAIDRGSQNIAIIRDADLVILATPVGTILKSAPLISKLVKPECLVSDVGSTKHQIVSKLDRIFTNYVGSHPLAGSEKRGVLNAHPNIFRGSLCILTPTKKTKPKNLEKLEKFWKMLGAKTIFLSTENHDRILSFVSHLPHVAAFSLMESMPKQYLRFSPSSLKDTTRIAASDSELWGDIFLSNRKNMLKTIALLQKNLSRIKHAINKKEKGLLNKILKEAQIKRKILR